MRDAPSYIVLIMTDTLLDTKHSKERASDTHEQDHEHDDQRIHLPIPGKNDLIPIIGMQVRLI